MRNVRVIRAQARAQGTCPPAITSQGNQTRELPKRLSTPTVTASAAPPVARTTAVRPGPVGLIREALADVWSRRQLIRYLMRHAHTTPFEMVEVKFVVRVPMERATVSIAEVQPDSTVQLPVADAVTSNVMPAMDTNVLSEIVRLRRLARKYRRPTKIS